MFGKLRAWIVDRYEDYRWSQYYKHSAWAMERTPVRKELLRWDENNPHQRPLFNQPMEIVVSTEEEKQQVLEACRYFHDMREIDTDYYAVGYLAHMYLCPDLIRVQPGRPSK